MKLYHLAIAFCFLLSSCADNNNKLIGKWEFVSEEAYMTIYDKDGVKVKAETDFGEDTFKAIKSFDFNKEKVSLDTGSDDGLMGVYSDYRFLNDSTITVRLGYGSADLKFETYSDTLVLILSHDYGADDPVVKQSEDSTVTGYNISQIGYYKKVKR